MKKIFIPVFLSAVSVFCEVSFLGRGVNLGNWLDAPRGQSLEGASSWGVEINAGDFSNIAQKGFDNVRIPARFSDYLTEQRYVSPEFMAKVKWAVDSVISNGMKAIIDVHHFEEMMSDPENHFETLKNIWTDISLEFKNYDDSKVYFELLNEPNAALTIELWNTYPEELIRIIRNTNPTRPILLSTADWGGFSTLKPLKIPEDDNLIITLHYYNPSQFTHQGADWMEGGLDWIGTRWTATTVQKLAMKMEFEEVYNYAKQKNLNIHIGEFGAYNPAKYEDRILWTEYAARLCNRFGFAFSYWEYSAGFGLYDPAAKKWREELVAALFSTKEISNENYRLSDKEIIRNGNFEYGAANWTFGVWHESGAATGTVTADGYSVTVSKVPTETWGVQFLQDNLAIEAGKTYLLSFDVSGDAGMSFNVCVETDTDYVQFGGCSVSVPAKNVKAIISPQETAYPVRLIFNFGYCAGTAVISNVSMKEIIADDAPIFDGKVKSKASVKNHKVFISKNTINAAPFAEFEIVSANGKILFSGKCGADGKAQIKDISKGIYTIRIKNTVSLKYVRK